MFQPGQPGNSDSWNCLMEINGSETMAQVLADVIIQNTGSAKGDHFWDNAEMNLLKALVLYVDQGFPPEAKNIGQVYKLLDYEFRERTEPACLTCSRYPSGQSTLLHL